jgi:hypothetical protein
LLDSIHSKSDLDVHSLSLIFLPSLVVLKTPTIRSGSNKSPTDTDCFPQQFCPV